jgi:hypothetical protein
LRAAFTMTVLDLHRFETLYSLHILFIHTELPKVSQVPLCVVQCRHGSSGPVPKAYWPAVPESGSTRLANQRAGTPVWDQKNTFSSNRADQTVVPCLIMSLRTALLSTVVTHGPCLNINTLHTVPTGCTLRSVLISLQALIISRKSIRRLVYVLETQ